MKLTIGDLKKLFPKNTLSHPDDTVVMGLNQDTRKLAAGEIYIAIVGENFNGHDFVNAAFEKGAIAALVSDGKIQKPNCLYVSDTVQALGELAQHHREKFTQPVIAITGSSGKTTNKEFITHVLSALGPIVATIGNLNNHIGVPLTLARFNDDAKAFVVEMGMSALGEIAYLAKMARPQIGLITNVGPAHMEGVGGTLQGVAKAKGELFLELSKDAVAIVNLDDALIADLPTRARRLTFGFHPQADIRAENMHSLRDRTRFDIAFDGKKIHVEIQMVGQHHVRNALAAFAVAHTLKMDAEKIKAGLESFKIAMNRGRLLQKGSWFFVDDTYNANPGSMQAAFESLVLQFPDLKKIGVLGGMLEIGPASKELHFQIGVAAKKLGLTEIYAYGGDSKECLKGFGYSETEIQERHFDSHEKMAAAILAKEDLKNETAFLFKGSRGMKMETVLEKLLNGE